MEQLLGLLNRFIPKNHVRVDILTHSFKNRVLIRKSSDEMATEDNAPGGRGGAGWWLP